MKNNLSKMKAVLFAAVVLVLAAGPAMAATHTKEALIKVSPGSVSWTINTASLAATATDSCICIINLAQYCKPGLVSTGAGLVNLTIEAYKWGTNVDSLRTNIQVGPGDAQWKTIYTTANINSNLQKPTTPTADRVVTKALTIPIADLDDFLKIIINNADATTAGTMTVRLKMVLPNSR